MMSEWNLGKLMWVADAWESILIVLFGFIISRALTALLVRGIRFLDPQAYMILKKLVFYSLFGAFIVWSLHHLGVDFKVLLGAAGVFSVAIGFASQTSASNLISGIFLVMEKPFVVGDIIRVNEWEGVVMSIDLLSTRMRTYDNLMVRVPNESLMKSGIVNLTRFPIRRADVILGISFEENLERVKNLFFDLAQREPLCLDEPSPQFFVQEFSESSMKIKFCVWTSTETYIQFKTQFIIKLKKCLDKEKVLLSIPHRKIEWSSSSVAGKMFPE